MSGIWDGYWQVVSDSGAEEIVEFRNTTTAVRLGPDRFAAFMPLYEEPGEGWRRLG